MAQWVKNPGAAAQAATEVWVQSLAQWVKGYRVARAAACSRLRFSPWPTNFYVPWVQPSKQNVIISRKKKFVTLCGHGY